MCFLIPLKSFDHAVYVGSRTIACQKSCSIKLSLILLIFPNVGALTIFFSSVWNFACLQHVLDFCFLKTLGFILEGKTGHFLCIKHTSNPYIAQKHKITCGVW